MLDRFLLHRDLDSILFSTDEQLNQLISDNDTFEDLGFDLFDLDNDFGLLF
jgi:hypothetical protein